MAPPPPRRPKPSWITTRISSACASADCASADCACEAATAEAAESEIAPAEAKGDTGKAKAAQISISELEIQSALKRAFDAGTAAACIELEEMMTRSYEAGSVAARAAVEEELGKAHANVLQLEAALSTERLSGGGMIAQMSRAQEMKELKRQVKSLTSQLKEMTSKYNEVMERLRVCGSSMIEAGDALREELAGSKARAKAALASNATLDERARRHMNKLAEHVESELFGVGAGDAERTTLILSMVMERPAIRRLLAAEAPRSAKIVEVSAAMLRKTRMVLSHLAERAGRADRKGTRSADDHAAFEMIISALVPEDAKEEHMMRIIQELLGIDWRTIHRAQVRLPHRHSHSAAPRRVVAPLPPRFR
jgi:hypothetical protein